ncbi:hypothetical protein TRFO_02252 [Tritrichomonas foetus]|uniref:Transmembrane amino acid transporter protein n=1 Tax=Tritrichomonas foetus TaxID=1144522 RepID=A0A1J4JAJ9_9EUKA|nr:hypothetical protein TRFO_02252 [Tritrichomonas foetus]|eukprot:OHS95263.1 hypothetical protein TRFO_02252 [Tritrichomonas foetus]
MGFIRKGRRKLTIFNAAIILINVNIGTGIMKIPFLYATGVIATSLLNLAVSLITFYSFYLLTLTTTQYKSSSLGIIWSQAKLPCSWIPCFIFFYISFDFYLYYFSYIYSLLDNFFTIYIPSLPETLHDYYIIVFIIFAICVIPSVFSKGINTVKICSYIFLLFLLFYTIHQIYWFVKVTKDMGFDPNNEIQLWFKGKSCLNTISSHFLMYMTSHYFFQTTASLRDFNRNDLIKLSAIFIGVCWAFYQLNGIFGYFTFFGSLDKSLPIFSHYEQGNYYVMCDFIAAILCMIMSLPAVINSARDYLINIFFENIEFTYHIYIILGLILGLMGLYIGSLSNEIIDWINFFADICIALAIFFIPVILFFGIQKLFSPLHFIGMIVMILLGLAEIVLSIYNFASSK